MTLPERIHILLTHARRKLRRLCRRLCAVTSAWRAGRGRPPCGGGARRTASNAVLTSKPIRIKADVASYEPPVDERTGKTPQLRRGNDVQFEIGVFDNGVLQDIANIASITLTVKDLAAVDDTSAPDAGAPAPESAALMTQTLDAAAMDAALTGAAWEDGSGAHARIGFSASETNIARGEKWFAVWVTTTGSPARVVTLSAGRLFVLEDGVGLADSPPDTSAQYFDAPQSDARYARRSENLADLTDSAAARGHLQVYSQVDTDGLLAAKQDTLAGTADVPGLDPALSGKADTSHTHTEGDIINLDKYSQAEVDALALSRAPVAGMDFDGEAGALEFERLDLTGDFSIAMLVKVEAFESPAAIMGDSAGNNNRFRFMDDHTLGIVGDAEENLFASLNVTLETGKWYHLALARGPGGDDFNVYIDGVLNFNSIFDNAFRPNLLAARNLDVVPAYYPLSAANVSVWNKALSAAEVADLAKTGRWPLPEERGGGVIYESDFSAGTDDWEAGTSAVVTGNVDTDADGAGVPPSDNWLKADADGGGSNWTIRPWAEDYGPGLYRISGEYFVPSGYGADHLSVSVLDNQIGVNVAVPITKGSVQAFEAEQDVTESLASFNIGPGLANGGLTGVAGTDALYLRNIKVERIGALAHWPLDDGLGRFVRDVSGNGARATASAAGAGHLKPGEFCRINKTITHTANGNFDLLDGWAQPAGTVIVEASVRNFGSFANFRVGTTSAGEQIVGDQGVAAGQREALSKSTVTRFAESDRALYVRADAAVDAEWSFVFRKI